MEISNKTLTASPRPGNLSGGNGAHYSVQLLENARADTDTVLKELGSQLGGLSGAEADSRLKQVGTNEIAREKRQSVLSRLLGNLKNPLVLLLLAHYGKEGRSESVLPRVNQEHLAQMVGTTRSRVSHFMNKFRKLGFVDYDGSSGGLTVNSGLLSVVLQD